MKDKEYKSSELWYNSKSKEFEPIPEMNPTQASVKLKITGRRIRDHKSKLDKIYDLRRNLMRVMVEKGRRITTLNELENEKDFILTGPAVKSSPGAIVNYAVVVEHKINIDEGLEKGWFIFIEETPKDENI